MQSIAHVTNWRRIRNLILSQYNSLFWHWRFLIELVKIRVYVKFVLKYIIRKKDKVCVVFSPSSDRPDLGTLLGCILLVRMLCCLGYNASIFFKKENHPDYDDFWQSAKLIVEEYCGPRTIAEKVSSRHFLILGAFLPVQILPRLLGGIYNQFLYGRDDFLFPKVLDGISDARKESQIAIAVRGDVISESRNTSLSILIDRLHEIPQSFEERKYVVYGHQAKAEECAKQIEEHLKHCSCERFGKIIEVDSTRSIYDRVKSFLRADFILSLNNHGLSDLAMFSNIPYFIESPRYRFAESYESRLYPWQLEKQKWKYNKKILEA